MQNPNPSEQDKKIQRNNLQRELLMKDADLKKIVNAKNKFVAEIRNFEKEKDRIDALIQMKEREVSRLEQDLRVLEAEMKSFKNKINSL